MALQVMHYANVDGRYETVGFFVDYPDNLVIFAGRPILGKIQDIESVYNNGAFDCLFIAIGYKHLPFKTTLYDSLKYKVPFASIIAAPQYIDQTVSIGKDVIVYPGVILDKNVVVEDNVLINLGATISHNTRIGNGSFVGVRVSVSGFCSIGCRNFLGTNSTLIDNITLTDDVSLGASTLVNKDIKEAGLYVGVPYRRIR